MQNRVCGPTAVFQTTTRPDGDPETRSRFLVTTLDESRSQTARILEAQRRARTLEGFTNRLQRPEILSRHHAFQRLLKPIPVFNPFAGRLSFSADRLLMRRDQPKYLAMIETIAFLHQMQRPLKRMTQDERLVPGDRQAEYVEVELSDIAMANELAADILGQSLDDLSGPSRRLLLLIEEMVAARARQQGEEPSAVLFTRRQVREFSRWSDYQVKTHICQLAELEYLVPVFGRFGRQYRYRLAWDGKGRGAEAAQLGIKSAEQLRLELYPEDLEGGKSNLAATWRG
jgi:PAS domain-containing protein